MAARRAMWQEEVLIHNMYILYYIPTFPTVSHNSAYLTLHVLHILFYVLSFSFSTPMYILIRKVQYVLISHVINVLDCVFFDLANHFTDTMHIASYVLSLFEFLHYIRLTLYLQKVLRTVNSRLILAICLYGTYRIWAYVFFNTYLTITI